MDAIDTARAGLMAASARFERSASRVARMDIDPSVDLVTETVEQVKAKHEFSANLQVIRFADEMWRSLLEIQGAR
jgi:flagellar basal body rod protein FlgC